MDLIVAFMFGAWLFKGHGEDKHKAEEDDITIEILGSFGLFIVGILAGVYLPTTSFGIFFPLIDHMNESFSPDNPLWIMFRGGLIGMSWMVSLIIGWLLMSEYRKWNSDKDKELPVFPASMLLAVVCLAFTLPSASKSLQSYDALLAKSEAHKRIIPPYKNCLSSRFLETKQGIAFCEKVTLNLAKELGIDDKYSIVMSDLKTHQHSH